MPSGIIGIGDNHPPKKSIDISAHIKTTVINSPIIKSKNGVEEYST